MAALVAFSIGAASAAGAHAAGRDEWQLSLREGAGTVNVDGRAPWGNATALDLDAPVLVGNDADLAALA